MLSSLLTALSPMRAALVSGGGGCDDDVVAASWRLLLLRPLMPTSRSTRFSAACLLAVAVVVAVVGLEIRLTGRI